MLICFKKVANVMMTRRGVSSSCETVCSRSWIYWLAFSRRTISLKWVMSMTVRTRQGSESKFRFYTESSRYLIWAALRLGSLAVSIDMVKLFCGLWCNFTASFEPA